VLLVLVAVLGSLNVKQRSRGLRVAECNLSEAALDNQLLRLRSGLGSFDSTLNLLLHSLHVVVASAAMSASSEPVVGLEQVGLSELVGRLLRVLSRSATDLTEDLVVEVLGNGCLGSSLVEVTGRGHQLLQLDASDEILVLGCHQTVVLCQLRDLVVALSTFGVLFEEGRTLCFGKLEQLLGMRDDHAWERGSPVVRLELITVSGRAGLNHWLALPRQAVRVLQNLAGLRRRALRLRVRRGMSLRGRLGRRLLLSLQDGGVLRRLRLYGLGGQLSVDGLLSKGTLLLVRMLRVLLVLLRSLQDLRRILAGHAGGHARHTRHTRERLALEELLLLLMVRVGMRVGTHARRRLHGRGSACFGAN
jgi:hypothetical protein